MARTMTDEQEREAARAAMRAADHAHGSSAKTECYAQAIAAARAEVQAELDSERDAHKLTRDSVKTCDVCGEECSTVEGHAMKDEIAALKERLKLAEAVCELMEARDLRMNDALAAWRAGK